MGWLDGMIWDLCVGLLYEHRFAVLIIVKIVIIVKIIVTNKPNSHRVKEALIAQQRRRGEER